MGPRLNDRDREIATFLARTKFAQARQLLKRFEIGRAFLYRRLSQMAEIGYVRSADVPGYAGAFWYTTEAGLQWIQHNTMRPPAPSVRMGVHDLALTDVLVELELRGLQCLTEREIRAWHRSYGKSPHLISVRDHTVDRTRLHTPDLVFDLSKHRRWYAIEVELSRKVGTRWRDLLTGFKERLNVDGFGGVLYLVHPEALPDRILELAHEVGLVPHFQLQILGEGNTYDSLAELVKADR